MIVFAFKPFGEVELSRLRFSRLNKRGSVTFLEANLKGIDQPLTNIRTGYKSIHQHENVFEISFAIIVRRIQFNSLPVSVQASESALHQAHQVGGYVLTRLRLTRRLTSAFFRFLCVGSKAGTCWKEHVKTSAFFKVV